MHVCKSASTKNDSCSGTVLDISRLVTQYESLQGFRNLSGRGENDAVVTDRKGFKTEERLTNWLRKFC